MVYSMICEHKDECHALTQIHGFVYEDNTIKI